MDLSMRSSVWKKRDCATILALHKPLVIANVWSISTRRKHNRIGKRLSRNLNGHPEGMLNGNSLGFDANRFFDGSISQKLLLKLLLRSSFRITNKVFNS